MAEFSLNTEFENFIKATLKDQEHLKQVEETITLLDENKNESSKSADFFQDNNTIKKKKFSKTSFLSNISYSGINKEDVYNKTLGLTFTCC